MPTPSLLLSCGGAALLLLPALDAQRKRRSGPVRDTEQVKHFRIQSKLLSEFWGRPMHLDAGVVLPPDHRPDEKLPVCYSIHGFGGSHRSAWRRGPGLVAGMKRGDTPRMLYVYLNARCPLGHHVFADSVNNGPVGSALVQELIPALEARYGAYGKPAGRFLTGHSSGGWSSLWVQLKHPDFFNGVWSTAPDSVDFRDFTGIDVYSFANAFKDPEGRPIMLVRRQGEFVMSLQQFVEREFSRRAYGGQFASFDAVFSPRGEDGRPMELFDKKSGKIDPQVARWWKKYDITEVAKAGGEPLFAKLRGKVHVYMGTIDTFRLEGALYLFAEDMKALDAGFDIKFVEGRDHGSLFQPHPKHWPKGMLTHIHQQMAARFAASR